MGCAKALSEKRNSKFFNHPADVLDLARLFAACREVAKAVR